MAESDRNLAHAQPWRIAHLNVSMRVMPRHAAPSGSSPHPVGWPSPEEPGDRRIGWPGDLPVSEPTEDDEAGDEPSPPGAGPVAAA